MIGLLVVGLVFVPGGLLPGGLSAQARTITPSEVIQRVEANQVHDTMEAAGTMVIRDRFGERTKTLRSWAEGDERMLIEFTNPEERGQKILRLEDELYLFFPDAEETIHLQGSALRDSIVGSDFSYEDLTGEQSLLDDYTPTGMETVQLEGRTQYLITLEAKERGVAYPRQKMWVDAELFVPRRVEYYSLSDRLLKTMEIAEVRSIAGKNVPVHFIMEDKMKRNSSTEFSMENLAIGGRLPAGIFSLEELSW
jgi:outer membrane lipoprotein-sorting protein